MPTRKLLVLELQASAVRGLEVDYVGLTIGRANNLGQVAVGWRHNILATLLKLLVKVGLRVVCDPISLMLTMLSLIDLCHHCRPEVG